MSERILIIKHGALGDMILATGPMKAIRARHPHAHIVLLTTRPFAAMMAKAPFIDEVWVDDKPRAWQFRKIVELIRVFNARRFDWVYDLQTSGRSTRYFKLFVPPKPHCSGLAKDASHRHHTPERTTLHTIDRQQQQLGIAGIAEVSAPDMSWLAEACPLPDAPFALLVPGGSAHRPEKRWPAEHYGELAKHLIAKGYQIVLLGAGAEAAILTTIETMIARPESVVNLCNRTSFGQIAYLARHAACAVGNDTGPMHIIAACDCNSVVIFNTSASNPDLCAPRGEHVHIAKAAGMNDITETQILDAIAKITHISLTNPPPAAKTKP